MILGLDHASSRFHLVSAKPVWERHVTVPDRPKLNNDQKRLIISRGLRAALDDYAFGDGPGAKADEIWVFAEEPLALKNPLTNRVVSLAAGALWAQHIELVVPVFWMWIDVASWQSWCGIKQNLKTPERKAQSRAYALEHGAPEDWEEDHYDAFDIALYGEHLLLQRALGC